jgi:PAS domain S-box-containing protein
MPEDPIPTLFDAVWLRRSGSSVRACALILIVAIALIDWQITPNYALGFLYVAPITLLGTVSGRLTIGITAIVCSVLREALAPFSGEPGWPVRLLMVSGVFAISGLLSSECSRRRLVQTRFGELDRDHTKFREVTQDYVRALIETTPVAVITLHQDGRVLLANHSAHEILGYAPGSLTTVEELAHTFPALIQELHNTHGYGRVCPLTVTIRRADGSHLRCRAWISCHRIADGLGLTCAFADESDELRTRETESVEWLNQTSDVLVSAALHEVRNLASASVMTLQNVMNRPDIRDTAEVRTACTLMQRVQILASRGMRAQSEGASTVALDRVLDDVRIIAEPVCAHHNIRLIWDVPGELPVVAGDQNSILQVMLNLLRNSVRALTRSAERSITVALSQAATFVCLRVQDSGPGVAQPESLFSAYTEGAQGAGLGLFISSVLMRRCGGDLRYEAVESGGACFRIDLRVVNAPGEER